MSYNKSDGSKRYNKEERGGWYCTNPKRHEENQQHHAADEPHVHHAERNDNEPERQPQARQIRQKRTVEEPVNPMTVPDQKKRTGCQIAIFIIIWSIMIPLIIAIISNILFDDDNDSQDEDYYEYYEEDIDSEATNIIE